MACNKIVLAFVGLCGLSLFVALSEAAPPSDAAPPTTEAPCDTPAPGGTTAPPNDVDPGKLGQLVKLLGCRDLGHFIKSLPGGPAEIAQKIAEIPEDHFNAALSKVILKLSDKQRNKSIDALGDQAKKLTGFTTDELKEKTADELSKIIQSLPNDKLGLIAVRIPKKTLGCVLTALPDEDVGNLLKSLNLKDFIALIEAIDPKKLNAGKLGRLAKKLSCDDLGKIIKSLPGGSAEIAQKIAEIPEGLLYKAIKKVVRKQLTQAQINAAIDALGDQAKTLTGFTTEQLKKKTPKQLTRLLKVLDNVTLGKIAVLIPDETLGCVLKALKSVVVGNLILSLSFDDLIAVLLAALKALQGN